jgi:hypothetical protein
MPCGASLWEPGPLDETCAEPVEAELSFFVPESVWFVGAQPPGRNGVGYGDGLGSVASLRGLSSYVPESVWPIGAQHPEQYRAPAREIPAPPHHMPGQ